MIRLAVAGATGKMGQAIIRLGAERVAGILGPNEPAYTSKSVQELSPQLSSSCRKALHLKELDKHIDVMIDFTRPEATLAYIDDAVGMKVPIVIGTTGFTDAQLAKVHEAARKLPLLLAPNMSVGMNLLIRQAATFAKAFGDAYDIDIVETHHHQKQDSPSGSAKAIGEAIVKAKGLKQDGYPAPETGMRKRDGLPRYHHVRRGGVIGEHVVTFSSPYETVELRHSAGSRDLFAEGALHAAAWLHGKPAGLYSMQDVIGVK